MTKKQEATKYVRKIYKFLKSKQQIRFSKMTKLRGYIEFYENKKHNSLVVLDHRSDVISSLIHEFIHLEHQDWTEEQVLELEDKIINSLSNRQIKNLIKRLAEAL